MKNNYAISAGHEITMECAQTILDAGGNAFDAAVAAGFAMFITETCMSSAGAGGFAMLHSSTKGTKMLDFFTQTPQDKNTLEQRDFYPVEVNFGNETEEFHIGMASIATPGIVKGLFAIYDEYCTMPLKELLFPAKKLAREGVLINEFQHIDLCLLGVILAEDPSMKSVFFSKDGKPLQVGERMKMPHLYNFLEMLEHEGEKEFYEGEISRKVDEDSRDRGGYIQRSDFQNYSVFWRKPIKIQAFSHTIFFPNGPSLGGGIQALLLDSYSHTHDWLKTITEIKKRYNTIGTIQAGMEKHLPELHYNVLAGPQSTKGTSHFNIVDKQGNVVSFSCSIGEGSGYFVPGTNMQMNNMMGESFLLPDGFHSWQPNARLHSMMTPTMVFDHNNDFRLSCGSGGAGRIPYMIAQVITKLIEEGHSLESAIEYPRAYLMGDTMHMESGYITGAQSTEYSVKEWDYLSLFFGGVHGISQDKNGQLHAHGDPRRYGVGMVHRS